MWKVLICDDEPEQGTRLSELLAGDEELCVSCCTAARELEHICTASRRPDILLMDIKLGEENGIELVKRLVPEMSGTQIIYVTGYVEYCTKVYETAHISFLLKPVERGDLLAAVERAKQRLACRRTEGIVFQSRGAVRFFPFEQIRYLESVGRQVRCVTDHGVFEGYGRLGELEHRLDGRFFQCHKSFVVNMERVTAFNPACFQLSSGEQVPVSARRRAEARLCFLHSLKAAAFGADTESGQGKGDSGV